MNKKALLAICVALLVPLIGYLTLKGAADSAVAIPRHYLPDSIVTKVVDGKMTTDTVWHTVENIRLQNQLGDTVSLYDIKNKAIVADFFFTSCGSICPKLTANMAKMQQAFIKGPGGFSKNLADSSIVQFLSFTIDPERDSVPVLKKYADKHGANSDNWWFLTGPKDTIYNFIFEQLRVDKYNSDGPLDPDFAHTQRFVLIDRDHHIRGYYNGLDSSSLAQLSEDIGILMLEKDPNEPERLPFNVNEMIIFFGITFVIVIIGMRMLTKRRKNEEKHA